MSELSFVDLMPADTPSVMFEAWRDCMVWAIGEPEIVAEFRRQTGNNWQPGRNGFERMIDEATGVDRNFAEAFVKWANVNVWGPIGEPEKPEAA